MLIFNFKFFYRQRKIKKYELIMGFIGLTNYKKSSDRLNNKHHKKFYKDQTLVDIKIQQLLDAGANHVYVSTDDDKVKNSDKVTFINREKEYCDNIKQFSYVLKEIFDNCPVEDNQDIIYTFTCCPLFSRYDEMYKKFNENKLNQIAVHPSSHYFLDIRKRPINFNFGLWHTYSQGLDPIYMFPYAGTVCKMKDLREVSYMIPREFEYFHLNQFEAIDIDTQEEFEMAQRLYTK
tara:strand:- start:1774 stop:2475 length:702 start_codon:yes stop_codon:yes gene_type:complete